MLGQSWLNEALGGRDGNIPDPTAEGEAATISSVVRGFLRNDEKFSREDISGYINTALQNEAADIWQSKNAGREIAEGWQLKVDEATTAMDEARAAESAVRRDKASAAWAGRYDIDRGSLAEAVLLARDSNTVLLDPETCTWVSVLDHDGLMSEATGLDVKTVFGANPHFDPDGPGLRPVVPSTDRGPLSVAPGTTARPVDFSREGASFRGAPSTQRPGHQGAAARGPAAPSRGRGPVRVGEAAADLVASLRRASAEAPLEDPAAGAGPELG